MPIHSTHFALFVVASWALILAPGPDMLYVLSRGVGQGRQAGILSALGVVCGLLVHTTTAASGLAFVLRTAPTLFLAVRYGGALYLIYLGVRIVRDKSRLSLVTTRSPASGRALFGQGVLSNVLNPKIAVFFVAFLPQFVDRNQGHAALQIALLGLTFALFTLCFLVALGYVAGSIGRWLTRRQRYAAALRWLSGGVLVGLGVRLALPARR